MSETFRQCVVCRAHTLYTRRLRAILSIALLIAAIGNIATAQHPQTIAVGEHHLLALKADALWAWGSNRYGQLALDPNTTHTDRPVNIPSTFFPNGIRAVCAGANHSLALDPNGGVWAWGRNHEGQLGDGTTTDRFEPLQVAFEVAITAIAAGDDFSLALDANGDVWAWGANDENQLGNGGIGSGPGPIAHSPVNITQQISVSVQTVSAGETHSLATTSEGLYGWGRGTEGQFVPTERLNRRQPALIQIDLDANDVNVAAGRFHSLLADKQGQVLSWGLNDRGQLGDGSLEDPNVPVFPFGDPNVVIQSLAAGANHSLALDVNGIVWVWGDNSRGQVGTGLADDMVLSPAALSIGDVNVIAAKHDYNLLLDAVNTAWTWGTLSFDVNEVNDVNEPVPTSVAGFPSFVTVTATAGGRVVEPNGASDLFFVGDVNDLIATADEHYNFTGWSGSAVDNGLVADANDPNTTMTIQGDHSVTANFTPVVYKLRIESGEGGTVIEPTTADVNATFTSPIRLFALIESDDWAFDQWVLLEGEGAFADAQSHSTTFTIESDARIRALFKGSAPAGLTGPLKDLVVQLLADEHGLADVTNPNVDHMALFEELYAANLNITDLTGLEHAVNLRYLDLNNNDVTDVNALTGLGQLKTLLLDGNASVDIEAVVGMEQLTVLHMSNVPIADYTLLGGFAALAFLVIDNTNQELEDIPTSWLTDLASLKVLSIRGNSGLRKSDTYVQRMHQEVCYPNGGAVLVDN